MDFYGNSWSGLSLFGKLKDKESWLQVLWKLIELENQLCLSQKMKSNLELGLLFHTWCAPALSQVTDNQWVNELFELSGFITDHWNEARNVKLFTSCQWTAVWPVVTLWEWFPWVCECVIESRTGVAGSKSSGGTIHNMPLFQPTYGSETQKLAFIEVSITRSMLLCVCVCLIRCHGGHIVSLHYSHFVQ